MNDNEKLIEEAASIVYGTVPASVIVPWHELDTNRRVEFEDAARAIRHVFEKSHTPTDDEREALATILGEPVRGTLALADRILAAGFRRYRGVQ